MQFSSENTKGVAMDCWEKKYETSPVNGPAQSSRFDISGNRVVREDLSSSPTVSSTESDRAVCSIPGGSANTETVISRMMSVSSLRRDSAKKMTVPNRVELVSSAQQATQSSSLSMTTMPFITKLVGGRSLITFSFEEKPPWPPMPPALGPQPH